VGIGYDPVEVNYEDWMPDIDLLHIDTSPADLDKNNNFLKCEVVGDLRMSLERLAAINDDTKEWDMNEIAERRKKMFLDLAPQGDRLDPSMVLDGLRKILPDNSILTCDVGAHLHLIGQAWKTYSPECQLMTNGCSTMGFGIPAAIAAKLSLPDRPVACVTGDGGFLMMAGEMATALRQDVKVIFILMSDRSLSLIHIKQEQKGYKTYATDLYEYGHKSPDNYFGVPVLTASTPDEYYKILKQAMAARGPVIVDVLIDSKDYKDLILRKIDAG